MKTEQLRAIQTPLKEQYKNDPRLRLTERYCVVYQTLGQSPQISVQYAK